MTPTTEELKSLLEKATQGPWYFSRHTKEFGPISRDEDQSYGMLLSIGDVFGDNCEADARLVALAPTLAARVVALEEVVKVAREALADIDAKVCWEINPSNYDHDDVCNMNSDWCEIGSIAEAARAKLEGK